MLKVFIWSGDPISQLAMQQLGKGEAAWGHASMEVSGGLPSGTAYISWWPLSAFAGVRNEPPYRHLFRGVDAKSVSVFSGKAYVPRNLSEDIDLEGGRKPLQIVLRGLDESNIKAWWKRRSARPSSLYDAVNANCSTTIYMALMAGGAYEFTPFYYVDRPLFSDLPPDPESNQYPLITPSILAAYAREIREGLAAAGKRPQGKKYPLVDKIQDASLRRVVKAALEDNGRLNLQETKLICAAAKDNGRVSPEEKRDLKRLVQHSRTMDNDSRRFVMAFLRSNT